MVYLDFLSRPFRERYGKSLLGFRRYPLKISVAVLLYLLLRRLWLRAQWRRAVTRTFSRIFSTKDLGGFGSEPRASESSPPVVMQSRVLRHTSFHDTYDVGANPRSIGDGMNGEVLIARHRVSGRFVAAKLLAERLGFNCEDRLDKCADLPEEALLYLRLSHPNICRLLEVFVEENGDIWLCMEYCKGGELFEQVAGTSQVIRQGEVMWDTEERVASLVRQMVGALRYLHGMGIVHRDIKLENWVFASPAQERIKLIDFGLAVAVAPREFSSGKPKSPKLKRVCGTCYYVAPEILSVSHYGTLTAGEGYDNKVDIWALGIVLFMLISGKAPFTGEDEFAILKKIVDSQSPVAVLFQGKRWKEVSSQCIDLISKCLVRDPQKRYSATEVQAHPWLRQSQAQPEQPSISLLKDLLSAGSLMKRCRLLAYVCGHLAQRVYLSPEIWTNLKTSFYKLEGEEQRTPAGILTIEDVACLCYDHLRTRAFDNPTFSLSTPDDTPNTTPKQPKKVWDASPKTTGVHSSWNLSPGWQCQTEEAYRELVAGLDLTGDGRLHFFEFLAALILAGRVQILESDVADAFKAFDCDCDGVVSHGDLVSLFGAPMVQCDKLVDSKIVAVPVNDPKTLLKSVRTTVVISGTVAEQPTIRRPMRRIGSEPHLGNDRQSQLRQSLLEWRVERCHGCNDFSHVFRNPLDSSDDRPRETDLGRGYHTPPSSFSMIV